MYHMWSALSILGMTMSRKIYVDHEYFQIHPTLYICLVGRQGLRKSTAKDLAKNLFLEVFPDYPLGASVQSREKIVEQLSKDDALRVFTDENGNTIEIKPIAFFINELKNFMSINPSGMVEFLTDIYDTKFFAASTIKHGLQPIINPCVNILACETPNWIIEKLKMNIIAGGFSRRMIYVYVTEAPERITFPVKSDEAKRAEEWCKQHLLKINELRGPFKWEPSAKVFFDSWFRGLPRIQDEVLEGFYEAMDVLAMKVAMLVAVSQENPKLVLTCENLKTAIAFLEEVIVNLPRLSIAAGRNELAVPQQKLLELIQANNGCMMEKDWHKFATKELNEIEYGMVKRMFRDTRQLYEVSYKVNGKVDMALFTAEKREELIAAGKWQGEK